MNKNFFTISAIVLTLTASPFSSVLAEEVIPVNVSGKEAIDVLVSLTSSEKKVEVAIGSTTPIIITAKYKDGHTEDVTNKVTWSYSKRKIAAVADGIIEGKAVGEVTLRASLKNGGSSKTTSISVKVVKDVHKPDSVIYTNGQIEKVEQPSSTSIKWYGYQLQDVDIYFTDSAQKKYSYIIENADAVTSQVKEYFDVASLTSKVPVYIFDNEKTIDPSITDGGRYKNTNNTVYIKGSAMNNPWAGDLRPTFAHEMTHAMQFQFLKQDIYPDKHHKEFAWIREGMAGYVALQVVTYKKLAEVPFHWRVKHTKQMYFDLLALAQQENNIDWSQMNSWPMDMVYNDYLVFHSINYFIEQQYGHKAYFNFILDLSEYTPEEASVRNFKKSEKELVQEWKSYFNLK